MAGRHPTIVEDAGTVLVLDQTRLPREAAMLRLNTLEDAAHAIRVMQVRGAPLIGATAAYGVALGLAADASDARLEQVLQVLAATRPTASTVRQPTKMTNVRMRRERCAARFRVLGARYAWAGVSSRAPCSWRGPGAWA